MTSAYSQHTLIFFPSLLKQPVKMPCHCLFPLAGRKKMQQILLRQTQIFYTSPYIIHLCLMFTLSWEECGQRGKRDWELLKNLEVVPLGSDDSLPHTQPVTDSLVIMSKDLSLWQPCLPELILGEGTQEEKALAVESGAIQILSSKSQEDFLVQNVQKNPAIVFSSYVNKAKKLNHDYRLVRTLLACENRNCLLLNQV